MYFIYLKLFLDFIKNSKPNVKLKSLNIQPQIAVEDRDRSDRAKVVPKPEITILQFLTSQRKLNVMTKIAKQI